MIEHFIYLHKSGAKDQSPSSLLRKGGKIVESVPTNWLQAFVDHACISVLFFHVSTFPTSRERLTPLRTISGGSIVTFF